MNTGQTPAWCERLYHAKATELILYGRALGLSHAEAEDVVQETFLALVQRETAPDNFKRNDDGGYSFVYKQPESPDEEARCKEAKEGCPVEAIGDNG